ncbi:MAG TPA: transposase [Terracidiphilus sp.]|nr:transposase [Terracidiphilus sp.]
MSQVTLLTGPERRRRWSEEDRGRILAAAFAPGAVVKDIARQYDVSTSLIYKWKREAVPAQIGPGFAPAIVVNEPSSGPAAPEAAVITVILVRGVQVRIAAHAPAPLVTAVLQALR